MKISSKKLYSIVKEETIKYLEEGSMGDLPLEFVTEELRDFVVANQGKTYPITYKAIQKFGFSTVVKYIAAFGAWVNLGHFPYRDGTRPARQHSLPEYLLKNRKILELLSPILKKPDILLRGLNSLKKFPKKNQNVNYSSKKPFQAWTESLDTAKGYCHSYDDSEKGVMLQVSGKEIFSKSDIVLCPPTGEFLKLLRFLNLQPIQNEWVFKVKETLKIDKWNYC